MRAREECFSRKWFGRSEIVSVGDKEEAEIDVGSGYAAKVVS